MKNSSAILAAAIVCLGLLPAHSQPGPAGGPHLGGAMSRLFGDNQTFSANLIMQTTDASGNDITLPGKISFDTGKARFEFNMSDMKGSKAPPEKVEQMKSMGFDQMVTIARPDKKLAYLIYPGLQSYIEKDLAEAEPLPATNDFKMDATEIGKETIDGHPCVKNKVVVTDKNGKQHESTVWNATDLKNFPVKIQTTESGSDVTMLFQNVSLAKPDASLFEAPSNYTKCDSMQTMMRQQMMKRMGAGGFPGLGH